MPGPVRPRSLRARGGRRRDTQGWGGAVSPPGEEVELVVRCPSLAAIRLTALVGEGTRPKIAGDKDPGLLV